jgi:hypothetical protein
MGYYEKQVLIDWALRMRLGVAVVNGVTRRRGQVSQAVVGATFGWLGRYRRLSKGLRGLAGDE